MAHHMSGAPLVSIPSIALFLVVQSSLLVGQEKQSSGSALLAGEGYI